MTSDAGTHTGATPPPPSPPSGTKTPRRLLRYPDEGPIAGVCAGVADYFNVDPTLVRIAAIVLACMGPGIPAYLLAWVFVPEADGRTLAPNLHLGHGRHGRHASPGERTTPVIGIVLIVIALSVLWGDWWAPAPEWFVPIGLIAVGGWLLLRRDRDDDVPSTTAGDPPPWRPSTPTATTAVGDATEVGESTGVDAPASDATEVDETTDATEVTDTVGGDGPPGDRPPWEWASTPDVPAVPPHPVHARRRRLLGPIVFGALLIWGGIATLIGVEVDDALAVGLCILGLGFVLGAFMGGSWGLVFPAMLVATALVVTSIIDIPWDGGIGDKEWTVNRTSQLRDTYELGIGEGTLDLSQLRVPRGVDLETEVQVGIGHLVVFVPDGVTLEVSSEVGAGESDILGRTDEGMAVDIDRHVTGEATKGTLHLDLGMGLGQIEVRERMGALR